MHNLDKLRNSLPASKALIDLLIRARPIIEQAQKLYAEAEPLIDNDLQFFDVALRHNGGIAALQLAFDFQFILGVIPICSREPKLTLAIPQENHSGCRRRTVSFVFR